MSHSHYIDIMLREATVAHDLHARLLHCVHMKNAVGAGIACAWPDWDEKHGEFGLLFRAFGNETELEDFAKSIAPLAQANLIRIDPIMLVPATTTYVTFVRNRYPDKNGESRRKRMERRAASQGRTIQSMTAREIDTTCHYLNVPSKSFGGMIRIHIRRIGSQDYTGGKAYGLGVTVPHF